MTRGEVKVKRRWWSPRYSLRTLAILVSLVCAYFGAWEATKRWGVGPLLPKTGSYGGPIYSSPVPFVIRKTTTVYDIEHSYGLWIPWKRNPFDSV